MLAGEILKSEGRLQWPDAALEVKDFALHGGGFPLRVRDAGVVAAIAISGLPSREDHDMIVTALAAHLNVTDFAATPQEARRSSRADVAISFQIPKLSRRSRCP